MLKRAILGCVLAVTGFGVARSLGARTRAASPTPAVMTMHGATPAGPGVGGGAPARTPLVPDDEAIPTLLRALDEPDPVTRLDAIDELVARNHVLALDRLLVMDPADDPMLGPTIIHGIGELGRAADPAREKASLGRLSSLLVAEKSRNGSDSIGNVITIIEALGVLGDPASARLLERELEDAYHDTAARTAIVQALGQVATASSLPALARLRTSAAAVSPAAAETDDFARELDTELIAAIEEASRAIRGR